MEVFCPRCTHDNTDDWDALQVGAEGPITCEACGQEFQLLVWECNKCEDHVASTWLGSDPLDAMRPRMRCVTCGAHHGQATEATSDEAEEV